MPPYNIGDAAYPLKTWLKKLFPQTELAEDEKTYNYRFSQHQMVVENAFGRLKGRWCRLIKRCGMTIENVSTVIATCCVLHNICELYQEGYNERWSKVARQVSYDSRQPSNIAADSDTHHMPRNRVIVHFKDHPIAWAAFPNSCIEWPWQSSV